MMINIIKVEILKNRRSFSNKIIIFAPIVTILMAYELMQQKYLISGSYNWWYTLILPFTITMISASMVINEKKKNYHGMFSIIIDKKKLWYAKVITGTIYLFISCFIFYILLNVTSFYIQDYSILPLNLLYAAIVLSITFAWQIPFVMIISEKIGIFFTVLISVICNFIIGVLCAVESIWWIPFSIPSRLMCNIIGVLPNGLIAENNDVLLNKNVIIPGLIINIILYFVMFYAGSVWFDRKEV